ncbi:MAG TPA: hypothetical protein VFM21_01665 [Terriglobia bacterium]|nr:hypothetical protein [Terriglobia bacterium]
MKLRGAMLLCGVLFGGPAFAQLAPPIPQVEWFGGGSYYRLGISGGRNMVGWATALDYNLTKHVGVVLDFGGQYERFTGYTEANYQYLIGPQFKARRRRLTFFARGLAGGDAFHVPNSTRGGLAVGGGGGVDLSFGRIASIRLIQIDSLHNHFAGNWNHNVRVAAGVVFKFPRP